MADIVLAALLLLAFSGALFCLGVRVGGAASSRRAGLVALVAVVALIGAFLFLQDTLRIVRLVPFSGAVVWGTTPLPLVALLTGVLSAHLRKQVRPAGPLAAALLLLGLAHAVRPFWGGLPPVNRERVRDGVVMQTSESSCSAASAATLLRFHGIPATEAEIARLAFTRREGTAMLGVYRALVFKTRGTPYRPDVLSGAGASDLRRAASDGPVLISVGLDAFPSRDTDPRYAAEWGWTPGLRHAVVLFGFLPDGRMEMGDPSVGRERWGAESLAVLWRGEGIRLTRR